jgi:hypothetical protein
MVIHLNRAKWMKNKLSSMHMIPNDFSNFTFFNVSFKNTLLYLHLQNQLKFHEVLAAKEYIKKHSVFGVINLKQSKIIDVSKRILIFFTKEFPSS